MVFVSFGNIGSYVDGDVVPRNIQRAVFAFRLQPAELPHIRFLKIFRCPHDASALWLSEASSHACPRSLRPHRPPSRDIVLAQVLIGVHFPVIIPKQYFQVTLRHIISPYPCLSYLLSYAFGSARCDRQIAFLDAEPCDI